MNLLEQLSKKAFWDVDMKTIDAEKHADYIIQKVFEYGNLEDMLNVHRYYGVKKIKEAFINYQFFLPDSAAFVAAIYNFDKKDLRCFSPKRFQKNAIH